MSGSWWCAGSTGLHEPPAITAIFTACCLVQAEESGVAAQWAPGRQVLSGAQTSLCTADLLGLVLLNRTCSQHLPCSYVAPCRPV